MSESREHKRRYNQRLEYIAHFERWLENEPPFVRLLKWHRWKKARPVLAEIENPTYEAR